MKPILLCILDGVGINKNEYGNAFLKARKPNFDYLWNNYPHSSLDASGVAVGLPNGQMGNSEVGHTNIGAGRVVYQPLELINQAIKNKEFFSNKAILNVIDHVKKNNSKLHIFGLLSDGGIHSHINHLFNMLEMVKENNITNVYLHVFLDGRDTLPNVALKYLDLLNDKLNELQIGKIATISGRYYAMDRDNRWERLSKAYDAIIYGRGEEYNSYQELIKSNYDRKIYDEFIIPGVLNKEGIVEDNDGLLVFNFRPDRLRELFSSITNNNFSGFETKKLTNLKLTTMFPVSDEVICEHAFELDKLNNTMGEYISSLGLKQLRIAETEKYAHVTYFFNGGLAKELKNCDEVLIPSSKVATYDLKPSMSAYEITDELLKNISNYDFIVLNFANGDMVGHTGNFDATVLAVEAIDECLGKIMNKLKEINGLLVLTADHGNSDVMLEDGKIITSHSTNKVPFIITDKRINLKGGKLADIAPTILKLMDLDIPKEMTGEVLIKSELK